MSMIKMKLYLILPHIYPWILLLPQFILDSKKFTYCCMQTHTGWGFLQLLLKFLVLEWSQEEEKRTRETARALRMFRMFVHFPIPSSILQYAGFNFKAYQDHLGFKANSSAREQVHAAMKECGEHLMQLNYRNFMISLKVFFALQNLKKKFNQ